MSKPHRPRKRFGQHFLVDPGIVSDILASLAAAPGDRFVEIGPGQGAITKPLAATGCELHAIELDRDLAAAMKSACGQSANVTIHQADALGFDFSKLGDDLRIIGNLPYNISTPLLFHLIDHMSCIRDMHLMLQKEVVDRMAASPGGRDFGRLSIMLACYLQIQPLFDVSPEAFYPPPKVMSTVVALRPLPSGPLITGDRARFSALLAKAFAKRRKTIRNGLKGIADEDVLQSAGIDPGARPEQIAVSNWVALAAAVHQSDT